MAEKTSALYLLKGMNDDGSGQESIGIRLDPNHENICDMGHEEFGAWCTSHATWHYDEFSYLKQEQALLVDAPMYELATASYMFIDNFQYFPKTFYAFVKGFEYVNDGCCKIFFDIDYVRTYWHLIRFKPCFVEREHPVSDGIGDNLLPEPVVTSDNWVKNGQLYEDFSELNYITYYTQTEPQFKVIDGVLTGMSTFQADTLNTSSFIHDLVVSGQEDKLIDVYSYPTNNVTGMQLSLNTSLDGYTPRFNKCYTAQFNQCILTDMQGHGVNLFFEFSQSKNAIGVYLNKTIVPAAQVQAIPVNYLNYERAYNYAIKLDNFPHVAFQGSSYLNWWANSGIANMIGNIGNTIHNVLNVSTQLVPSQGSLGGLAASTTDLIVNQALYENTIEVAKLQGSRVFGDTNAYNPLIGLSANGIYLIQVCQPYNFIKRIDDYFFHFGYQTNQLKQPNINSRSDFNYVKTADCACYGDCPAQAIEQVQAAFNRGVTIWHNIDTMLDY